MDITAGNLDRLCRLGRDGLMTRADQREVADILMAKRMEALALEATIHKLVKDLEAIDYGRP